MTVIGKPVTICRDCFQTAWLDAIRELSMTQWELRNLVVQICDPEAMDEAFQEEMEQFSDSVGILRPKDVAYTIFPHGLYRKKGTAAALFTAYNRPLGFYDRKRTRWGTYFRRMTCYEGPIGIENQLDNIIRAIRERVVVRRAAYTIVIQEPGKETVRPIGGPCLNYISVQLCPGTPPVLGLLAVYRNHEFLERAYGNYWGLCNLLRFLAREVDALPGALTCVSSHAYVWGKKRAVSALLERMQPCHAH